MGFRIKVTVSRQRLTSVVRRKQSRSAETELETRSKNMDLFRTKPLEAILAEAEDKGEGTLNRTLGVSALTLLGVGAIIGTGIFVLTGQAAGKHAGPAVVISMILAGVVSALAALCYSEFASSVPISGSAYTYSYATLGEFVAWIIGWDLIVEYAIGNIAVAISWSDYFTRLMSGYGMKIPAFLTMDYLSASRGFSVAMSEVETKAGLVGGEPASEVGGAHWRPLRDARNDRPALRADAGPGRAGAGGSRASRAPRRRSPGHGPRRTRRS